MVLAHREQASSGASSVIFPYPVNTRNPKDASLGNVLGSTVEPDLQVRLNQCIPS